MGGEREGRGGRGEERGERRGGGEERGEGVLCKTRAL